MSAFVSRTVLAACLAASLPASAGAAPFDPESGRAAVTLPSGDNLLDGRVTLPPRAFESFCTAHDDQCVRQGDRDEISLDDTAWETLRGVNGAVNRRIVVRPDTPGTDSWDLDVTSGDCDEYALAKRQELLRRGWPSAALSLTAAYISSGQAHLVLTVRTDRGDLVLDNLRDNVIAADRTGYRWIARQSSLHPRLWVRVLNPTTPVARLATRPVRTVGDDAVADPIGREIGKAAARGKIRETGRDIGHFASRAADADIRIGLGD